MTVPTLATILTANQLLTAVTVVLSSVLAYLHGPKTVKRIRKRIGRPPGDYVVGDGVNASRLPRGLRAYLGYVAGEFANYEAVKASNPDAHIFPISPFAAVLARILDVEPKDAVPGQALDYTKRAHAARLVPMFYTDLSELPAVVNDLRGGGVPRSAVQFFTAHPNGRRHRCNSTCFREAGLPETVIAWVGEAEATQYEWTPGYDLSLFRGDITA